MPFFLTFGVRTASATAASRAARTTPR
jgi:hypothetical protein